MHQIYEPSVFLQKTALNLVKCGLHSRTYYLHPHIGGPHPVLYFIIQATEKYSNSYVLDTSEILQNSKTLAEVWFMTIVHQQIYLHISYQS